MSVDVLNVFGCSKLLVCVLFQQLVDLMERVSTGQIVTELEVPPPLVITPQTGKVT